MQRKKKATTRTTDSDTIKNAIALQDHYARKFQILGLPVAKRRRRPTKLAPINLRDAKKRKKEQEMLNSDNLTYKDILSTKFKGVEKLSKEGRSKNFNKYMQGLTMA